MIARKLLRAVQMAILLAIVSAGLPGCTSSQNLLTNTATLTSITIVSNPSPATVSVGGAVTFTATGGFSDGSTQLITSNVNWASSNTNVGAAPSSTGAFSALAAGTTSVTASANGVTSNSITVTVSNGAVPTLTGITVTSTPTTVTNLTVGTAVTFVATGNYSNGSTQVLTSSVTWASSTPATGAAPSSTGAFTTLAAGSTNISASFGGITSNVVPVTVIAGGAVTLTKITLTSVPNVTTAISSGSTVTFTATGTFSNNSTGPVTNVTFTSSNTSVGLSPGANGIFTANATGTTNVTASSGGITSNAIAVTVIVPPTLTAITLTSVPGTVNALSVGNTVAFTANGTFSNGSNGTIPGTVTFTSSNATVGTIATNGTFTALAAGSTNITATASNGTSNVTSAPTTVTVQAAVAAPTIAFLVQPPLTVNPGSSLATPVQVVVLQGGLPTTTQTNVTLNLAGFSGNNLTSTVSNNTATTVNGIATFTGLQFSTKQIGGNQLTASATGVPTTSASNFFLISVAPPPTPTDNINFVTQPPASVAVNTSFTVTMNVTNVNNATQLETTNVLIFLGLQSSSGKALPFISGNQATAVNGVATFNITITSAGANWTLVPSGSDQGGDSFVTTSSGNFTAK